MSNVLLDGPLGESLIRRLAADDEFRALFARNPVEGLREIGLSTAQMMQLSPRCLSPQEPAPKAVFEQMLTDIGGESFRLAMSFHVQHVRMRMSATQVASIPQTDMSRTSSFAYSKSATNSTH